MKGFSNRAHKLRKLKGHFTLHNKWAPLYKAKSLLNTKTEGVGVKWVSTGSFTHYSIYIYVQVRTYRVHLSHAHTLHIILGIFNVSPRLLYTLKMQVLDILRTLCCK